MLYAIGCALAFLALGALAVAVLSKNPEHRVMAEKAVKGLVALGFLFGYLARGGRRCGARR